MRLSAAICRLTMLRASGRACAKVEKPGGLMKHLACIVMLAVAPAAALAAEKPDWAFPVTEKAQPPSRDDGKPKTAPGSTLSRTRAEIDNMFDAPDWFPDMHPPMPKVVQFGNKETNVRACGVCHLPTGTGHDESA